MSRFAHVHPPIDPEELHGIGPAQRRADDATLFDHSRLSPLAFSMWHPDLLFRKVPGFGAAYLPTSAADGAAWLLDRHKERAGTARPAAGSGVAQLVQGFTRRALAAAAVLALAVPMLAAAPAYNRPAWLDLDGNGRNTRADVLAAHCRSITWDAAGRTARQAVCKDFYTGREIATDTPAQALHVDHVLAAAAAWRARFSVGGAWRQDDGTRCERADKCAEFRRFFNDRENLRVTRARTNMQKGDRGPADWCPAVRGARLATARIYRAMARKWALPTTAADERGLRAWERGECAPGARVLGGDL